MAAEYPVAPGILRLFVYTVFELRNAVGFERVSVKGGA